MNENLTELVVVIDKSGSMEPVRADAIGGFNAFLSAQQKAEGQANITVVQFDTVLEYYAENVDVKTVEPLDTITYVPRGSTALYDAVGMTIDKIGKKLASMAENDRPAKVIFAILTDGEENSSREYTGGKVKSMIEHQRDVYKWDFVFLAAGEGAFEEAQLIGMDINKTIKFANTGINQTKSYQTLASYAVNSRSMSSEQYAAYSASVDLQSMMDSATPNENTVTTTVSSIKKKKAAK